MIQIVELTDEESRKIYMDTPKEELVEMLIECNKFMIAGFNRAERYEFGPVVNNIFTCPVCRGKQKVPAGFYMAIGVDEYSVSDLTPEPCRSCDGGVIKT